MRNKNLWIILAVVLLIAAVFGAALLMQPQSPASTGEAQAFLRISVDGTPQEPIPLTEDGELTLTQPDGESNTIRYTSTSVWMASANCHNQDCVEQGVVSLDTMDSRVLGNMIICLPHRLTLELCTAEEVAP